MSSKNYVQLYPVITNLNLNMEIFPTMVSERKLFLLKAQKEVTFV